MRFSIERGGDPAAVCRWRRLLPSCDKSVLIVDASVLAPALADDTSSGDTARARLRGETLAAPHIIDLEVTSVIRRQLLTGALNVRRSELAIADLVALPLRRLEHRRLLDRCWELRQNLTVYDASYVALAELFGVILVTGDARLARAPGVRCPIELVS
jgi:predicted nucleic acid-binding protein